MSGTDGSRMGNSWQDIVLSAGSLIFAFALLPSVFSPNKPSLWTSLSTGIVLAIFTIVYASLSLWYAVTTTALTAVLWLILAFQKKFTSKGHKP